MMASRKIVLDKNKKELLDSVNTSNKVYTNEELSILVGDLQKKVEQLQVDNTALKTQNSNLTNLLEQQASKLASVQLLANQNKFQTKEMIGNLNDVTEKTASVIAFSPTTLNKPNICSYGIVVNYIFGNEPPAGSSTSRYWRFQIAICDNTSEYLYVRKSINMANWTSWTAK